VQLRHTITVALLSIAHNKLLSFVTILGFAIGIAALTTLNATLSGSATRVTSRMELLGTIDLVIQSNEAVKTSEQMGLLTLQDTTSLANSDSTGELSRISPELHHGAQARWHRTQLNVTVAGINPNYLSMRNISLVNGRFVSWFHVEDQDRVAILGASVAQSLFAGLSPLDQTIYIDGHKFRVIGSLHSKLEDILGAVNPLVFIPVTTAHTLFADRVSSISLNSVSIELQGGDSDDQIVSSIENTLQITHHLTTTPDFTITNLREVIQTQERPSKSIIGFTGALFGVSFIIGGFSLMNMMIASVIKRNREIGIRKAVGATRLNILTQFVIEGTLLAILGGGIGLTVGAIGSEILANTNGIATELTLRSLFQGFVISLVGGALFSIYPAILAATTEPAPLLRYD